MNGHGLDIEIYLYTIRTDLSFNIQVLMESEAFYHRCTSITKLLLFVVFCLLGPISTTFMVLLSWDNNNVVVDITIYDIKHL